MLTFEIVNTQTQERLFLTLDEMCSIREMVQVYSETNPDDTEAKHLSDRLLEII